MCNRPVFDLDGRHVGTPDLFDPAVGLVGEYDSALHLEGAQRARDVRREGLFRALGLEYVTMLSADLARPDGFVPAPPPGLRPGRAYAVADRAWTVELPPWWVPTFTVEQRRALDDRQRERFLKLRLRAG